MAVWGLWLLVWAGCGVGTADVSWIGEDTAYVECAVAGGHRVREKRWAAMPLPRVPKSLFVGAMDPRLLARVGFADDTVVCASLEAPSRDELQASKMAIRRVERMLDDLAAQAKREDRCVCDDAHAVGLRAYLARCDGVGTQFECSPNVQRQQTLKEAMRGFDAALREAWVPRLHWRLFGKSRALGWFRAHVRDWLEGYGIGAEVITQRRDAENTRDGGPLLALIERFEVTAVLRMRLGRELLIVRELPDQRLVIDLLALPNLPGIQQSLVAALDRSQADRIWQQIAAPDQARAPLFVPREAPVVELNLRALERVDEGLILVSRLSSSPYDSRNERGRLEADLATRLALRLPTRRPQKGVQLELRAELSDDGVLMGGDLVAQGVFEAFRNLANHRGLRANFWPGGKDPGFFVRGQALERVWRRGGYSLAAALVESEKLGYSQLRSDGEDWRVDLDARAWSTLAGRQSSELSKWMPRLAEVPHRISGGITDQGARAWLRLEPR